MNIEPTFDMDQVKKILMIPEVWERAAEDGADKETYYPGFDAMCGWLLCKEGDEIVGLIYVHNDNAMTIKMHPYILPDHRGMGKSMMMEFYSWIVKSCPTVIKVLVTIPFCHKRVYKFAKRVGFVEEGINRGSYVKNGEIVDQWNLGLTIDEIRGLI